MPRVNLQDLFSASGSTIINTASIGLTSTLILNPNLSRRGVSIYNNGANSVYIAFDTFVSSSTHMTLIIPTFAHWTHPLPIYLGAMAAIRNSGTGILMITELF